jgi:hypothetical protein
MSDASNSFTELELAFFRAGDEMTDESTQTKDDEGHRPTSLWAKLTAALKRS